MANRACNQQTSTASGGRRTAEDYISSQRQREYEFAVNTFYVGTLKGVGRIYQQTFVDTYSKMAFAKLYTTKTPITAADLLNDRVLPFFEHHELPMLRILTDRGTEYCGKVDQHDYQLYLALDDIDHTKTKAKSPQTNGICERFHRTILDEFYKVTFRKKLYSDLEDLTVRTSKPVTVRSSPDYCNSFVPMIFSKQAFNRTYITRVAHTQCDFPNSGPTI